MATKRASNNCSLFLVSWFVSRRFNVTTIFCLFFFALEVLLSSFCKQDYFLGFFFVLDCVSTASLLLDLTWVADSLVSDDFAVGDQARGGRTARLGASVGRVVRVIRLVRIVKLYKAAYERIMAEAAKNSASSPGEETIDDWDNPDYDDQEQRKGQRESAVGKKLVALTTRRVIILVLVMLMCMPVFVVSNSHGDLTSAAFGASSVFDSYRHMKEGIANRSLYEESILKYFYYHNWFAGRAGCDGDSFCPAVFLSHVFWVGFAGRDKTYNELRNYTAEARLQKDVVVAWDAAVAKQDVDYVYVMGSFPAQAQDLLSSDWDIECQFGGWNHLGQSLLSTLLEDTVSYAVRCPQDLRPQERFRIQPSLLTEQEFDDWHLAFFFDARPYVRVESQNNMMLTGFICLVLCVASLQFSK
ncbi:cya, partial [Symbiodinium necroappetens]